MTKELQDKITKFTAELNAANAAFVCVVAVSGTSPRWWSNLQRFSQGASEQIKHALNECGHAIAQKRDRPSGLIVPPNC